MRYFAEKTLQRRIKYLTEFANMSKEEQDAEIKKLLKEDTWFWRGACILLIIAYGLVIYFECKNRGWLP